MSLEKVVLGNLNNGYETKTEITNQNQDDKGYGRIKKKSGDDDDGSDTRDALPEEHDKEAKKKTVQKWYLQQDLWMWLSGMVFCAILIAIIQIVGDFREWDAQSGFTHNATVTSQDRFLPEPYTPEEGILGRYGPGATGRWYYWQIKPDMRTFWTHFFPWICYVCHQVLIWITIYRAQVSKAHEPLGSGRYSTKLRPFNVAAFALNAFFHLLHFINTHVTYDATAPDVSISSSQGSVIMLLVFVMLIEYKERGIFFGWPVPSQHKDKISRRLLMNYGPVNITRKYHGYAFAWAAVYTFWYHPMENTWGHHLGFIYTWIIMLQGSLMFTSIHLNKYWRVLQEMFVIIHAGVVARQTAGTDLLGTALWPMFVFGFLLCFVLTQIFSLPFWRLIPTWCRFIPLALYIAVVLWAYSWIPNSEGQTWVRLAEVPRIPGTYYLFFFMGWALLFAFLKIDRKWLKSPEVIVKKSGELCSFKQAMLLCAAMLVYGVHVGIAVCGQYMDWQAEVTVFMIVFVAVFMVGCCISFMFLRYAVSAKIVAEKCGGKENLEKIERISPDNVNG